jgi:hypothetical protein
MRIVHKSLALAIGLLSVGILSSSVLANPLPVGTFTLSHSTQLNGTMLPAGEYHFKLSRTQTDTNMLVINGEKQTITVLVFAQSACDSCKTEALKMTVLGNTRIVTSLDLPGYHLEFKMPRTEGAKEATSDPSAWVEQVSVHVDPTK